MSIRLTHAMILAAGLGTRMRPLTLEIPKPLIPVAGKPMIDWNLDWIRASGIDNIVINSSYLAQKLEVHVEDENSPTKIHISREGEPPLETGGGVKKALPLLGLGPFLTMNSDAILPLQPGKHPAHRLADAWHDDLDFMMLLVPRSRAIGWSNKGDFVLEGSGRIRRPGEDEEADYIFSGVELIHPRAFAEAPEGAFSLSRLWQRELDEEGHMKRVGAIVHEGPWLNVGDLKGLAVAEDYFASKGN